MYNDPSAKDLLAMYPRQYADGGAVNDPVQSFQAPAVVQQKPKLTPLYAPGQVPAGYTGNYIDPTKLSASQQNARTMSAQDKIIRDAIAQTGLDSFGGRDYRQLQQATRRGDINAQNIKQQFVDPAFEARVKNAYAAIGRTGGVMPALQPTSKGVLDEASYKNVTQAEYDYWSNLLKQGKISGADFQRSFLDKAANEIPAANLEAQRVYIDNARAALGLPALAAKPVASTGVYNPIGVVGMGSGNTAPNSGLTMASFSTAPKPAATGITPVDLSKKPTTQLFNQGGTVEKKSGESEVGSDSSAADLEQFLLENSRSQLGPVDVQEVRSSRGPGKYDTRLSKNIDGLEAFADVDVGDKKLSQLGARFTGQGRIGNYEVQYVYDPETKQPVITGAIRKELSPTSDISAQGAYVPQKDGKDYYNAGVRYTKRFEDGGEVLNENVRTLRSIDVTPKDKPEKSRVKENLDAILQGLKDEDISAKDVALFINSFIPVSGDIQSAAEGYQAFKDKDYLGAGLGAAGALPLVPNTTKFVRGSISDLINKVKNERGEYMGRRAERAADEVPNLENQYSREALERLLMDRSNPQALMVLDPKDFEEYAMPIAPGLTGSLGEYRGFQVPEGMTYDQYIDYLAKAARKSGLKEIPFLGLGETASGGVRISGHEGRHRTRALSKLGDKSTLIELRPGYDLTSTDARRYKDDYIEALRARLGLDPTVAPEAFPDVQIPMPEPFKHGGEVTNFIKAKKFEDGGEVLNENVRTLKSIDVTPEDKPPVTAADIERMMKESYLSPNGVAPEMGEVKPKYPALNAWSKGLEMATAPLNKYALDKRIPLVGGMTAADFTPLNDLTSLARDVSYGDPVVRGKSLQTSKIDPRLLAVADIVPVAGAAAKGATTLAKAGAKEVARQVETGTGVIGRNTMDPRMYAAEFYSPAARAVESHKMDKMPASQWMAWLSSNAPKAAKEELAQTEAGRWLKEQKGNVAKQDLLAVINKSSPEILTKTMLQDTFAENAILGQKKARFGDFTLPGNNANYREMTISLPIKKDMNYKVPYVHGYVDETADTNRVAHVRMNDRQDRKGNSVLFVEEVQSDWAQTGREEGFSKPDLYAERRAEIKAEMDALSKEATAMRERGEKPIEIRRRLVQLDDALRGIAAPKGVPKGPYVEDTKAWTGLALKKIIEDAVDKGYNSVAFTTGAQQNARYDLAKAKTVSSIEYAPIPYSDNFSITGLGPQGNLVSSKVMSIKNIEKVYGDDIANTIRKDEGERPYQPGSISENSRVIKNVEVDLAGRGMTGFYDEILPQATKDVLKQLGVKAEIKQIDMRPKPSMFSSTSGIPDDKQIGMQWGFDITPELIAAVKEKGISKFKHGGEVTDFIKSKK
jgi:hypothetical protein